MVGRHLGIFRRWTDTKPRTKINQEVEDFLTARGDQNEARHYFHTVIGKIPNKKKHTLYKMERMQEKSCPG